MKLHAYALSLIQGGGIVAVWFGGRYLTDRSPDGRCCSLYDCQFDYSTNLSIIRKIGGIMKTFKSFNIELKLKPGTFIEEIAKDAVKLAGILDTYLYFTHNGVGIDISPTTTEGEIVFAYYQCTKNRQ